MMAKMVGIDVNAWEPGTVRHLISPHADLIRRCLGWFFAERTAGRCFAFPSMLIYAPSPGYGRRLLARVIANELGIGFTEMLGSSFDSDVEELASSLLEVDTLLYLTTGKAPFSNCVRDLVHGFLTTPTDLTYGKSYEYNQFQLDIPIDKTLVVSTENPYVWEGFRHRFPLVLRYTETSYSPEDYRNIAKQRVLALGWAIQDDALAYLLGQFGVTPLVVMRLLHLSWISARAEDKEKIELSHVKKAWQDILANGVGPSERRRSSP